MNYIPTIGMEIHFHLKTKSKMFCGCANEYFAPPNKNICPVCTGQPGALPVPNRQAVEWVARVGLALGCKLADQFNFERKNYFYPDLPKGYQITSTSQPPCIGGKLMVGNRAIRINHIHLEEDTGSLKHSATGTLVDLNRAGAPLVELVTEADLASGWEAKTFCSELQLVLRSLGITDADMEKGQMRCEVNISVRPENQDTWGTKVEIKNLNSFRSVERAIDYEIKRQSELLDTGKLVLQATRGWDEQNQQTVSQRVKEEAHDYRYFPEPDIPPLTFDQHHYEQLAATLPELPSAKRQRFQSEYGFTAEDARVLTDSPAVAEFTEQTLSELREWLSTADSSATAEELWQQHRPKLAKLVAGWLTSELFKLLYAKNQTIDQTPLTPENFAELLTMLWQHKINSSAGQKVLRIMVDTGRDPSDIVETENLAQVDDAAELTAAVQQVLAAHPAQAEQYRAGKTNILQFLIGRVMKETNGKANPATVHKLLIAALDGH